MMLYETEKLPPDKGEWDDEDVQEEREREAKRDQNKLG